MGAVYFYHLTRQPLEAVLPMLLGKARQAGWRVEVRGSTQERMEWLDDKLWLAPEEEFLAHGLAGGPHDLDQPILLTHAAQGDFAAQCLMTVDGADIGADEATALTRACVLFDGNDPSALDVARQQWRSLTEAGCAAQYWSQESGSWAKKAEKNVSGAETAAPE